MKVIFSRHANLKIAQRKLSKRNIIATINHPDSRKLGHSGREELFKKFRTNYLKVIVRQGSGVTVVITAHWIADV